MILEDNTVNPVNVSGGGGFDTLYQKRNRFTGVQGFTQWESIINNYADRDE